MPTKQPTAADLPTLAARRKPSGDTRRRITAILGIAILAILTAGCALPTQPTARILPPRGLADATPPALAVSLRPYNWTDAAGSGSCVHASTCYNLLATNQPDLAETWRRRHAGGETATTIRQYHDAAGLRYYFTLSADPELLDWATKTRRSCLIWYFPAHCVNFVGFSRGPDGQTVANLIDNNRPTQIIRIERQTFLRSWAGYGGFALALADAPIPPPLYDATQRTL
jgi:hypothetical protein